MELIRRGLNIVVCIVQRSFSSCIILWEPLILLHSADISLPFCLICMHHISHSPRNCLQSTLRVFIQLEIWGRTERIVCGYARYNKDQCKCPWPSIITLSATAQREYGGDKSKQKSAHHIHSSQHKHRIKSAQRLRPWDSLPGDNDWIVNYEDI